MLIEYVRMIQLREKNAGLNDKKTSLCSKHVHQSIISNIPNIQEIKACLTQLYDVLLYKALEHLSTKNTNTTLQSCAQYYIIEVYTILHYRGVHNTTLQRSVHYYIIELCTIQQYRGVHNTTLQSCTQYYIIEVCTILHYRGVHNTTLQRCAQYNNIEVYTIQQYRGVHNTTIQRCAQYNNIEVYTLQQYRGVHNTTIQRCAQYYIIEVYMYKCSSQVIKLNSFITKTSAQPFCQHLTTLFLELGVKPILLKATWPTPSQKLWLLTSEQKAIDYFRINATRMLQINILR